MHNTHIPFHQKYRPKKLDELVGQEFISTTLKQALLSKKIAPAYLFNGPRGTGKTSSARIFAKSLNCLSSDQPTINPCGKCELCREINEGTALDIIEIDAASNTGVENIREIIDRARFSPTLARWKVYVIDECHMLSTAASNALLKTIEEPPARVVFILATTNPERVLTTIQSRCQNFDFKRINTFDIIQHLSYIADKESIKCQEQALQLIAKRSNGGMRDAQSLLDQISLMPEGITTKNVQNLLGEVSEIDLISLINSLIDSNPESLLISCNKLYDAGNEPIQIINGLLNITRDLLLKSVNNKYSDLFYTSVDFQSELDKFTNRLKKSKIIDWHNKLKNVEYQIKTSDNPRLWLEIHLTSILDTKEQAIVTQNKTHKNDQETHKYLKNQDLSQNMINEKLMNTKIIASNTHNQNKPKILDTKELVQGENNSNKTKNYDHSDLKDKWAQILSNLELPSTRMLLSQQAELLSVNSNEIEIALTPNWENMIKSRKVIIEKAVKKIFGEKIKINFSKKKLVKSKLINSQEKVKSKISNDQKIRKIEIQKYNMPNFNAAEDSFKNSSKNLADFFNGEIIDFDE